MKNEMLMVTFVVVAACAGLSYHTQNDWKLFRSSTGFSILYPSSWFRQNLANDKLEILSTKGYWTAVVIARGEAEIWVQKEIHYPERNISQLISYYGQGARCVYRKTFTGAAKGKCNQLREAIWRKTPVSPDEVPPSNHANLIDVVSSGFFCRANTRTVTLEPV